MWILLFKNFHGINDEMYLWIIIWNVILALSGHFDVEYICFKFYLKVSLDYLQCTCAIRILVVYINHNSNSKHSWLKLDSVTFFSDGRLCVFIYNWLKVFEIIWTIYLHVYSLLFDVVFFFLSYLRILLGMIEWRWGSKESLTLSKLFYWKI